MNVGIAFPKAVRSGTLLSRLVTPVVLVATVFFMTVMMVPILEFGLGSTAYADDGGGGGGGGNGGGDKNNKPMKGDLYGDVVYLLRDDWGIPRVVNGCIRPLDEDGYVLALTVDDTDSSGGIEVDEELEIEGAEYNACSNKLSVVTSSSSASSKIELSDEDEDELEACDPISNCAPLVVEVELGRLSMLRAPPSVVDKALGDANDAISNAKKVTLDWGGRVAPDDSSLDAPLVNLAMMREFMGPGFIDSFDPEAYASSNGLNHYGTVVAAAFGFGAGDDKEGMGIDSEVTMRVLESLQFGQPYFLEADGIMTPGIPTETDEPIYRGFDIFLDKPEFGEFKYKRSMTYPGNVMYDVFDQLTDEYNRVCQDVISSVFVIDDGNGNFTQEADPGEVDNLEGFALAANDARRVLLFVHDGLIKYVDSVYETTPFVGVDGIEDITNLYCSP